MSYISLEIKDYSIRCEVKPEITSILSPDDLPLIFEVYPITAHKVVFSTELLPGTWALWGTFRDHNATIKTKKGILLKELIYDYQKEDLEIYEFWDYFTKMNKNTRGLILGAGDGTWGEWVMGIDENNIGCYMIEGSIDIFKELIHSQGRKNNTILFNDIVSPDGEDYIFYDADEGFSSINPDYQKNFKTPNIEKSYKRTSKKFSDLLDTIGKIDWIRFDVEGIDYDLIKSVDPETFRNMKMIQIEHLHMEEEKINDLDTIFMGLGFHKITFWIDTVYLKF